MRPVPEVRQIVLESPQDAHVRVGGREVLMLTSNNYLGFANHPRIREAQKRAVDRWGAGLASVSGPGSGGGGLVLQIAIAFFASASCDGVGRLAMKRS